MQHATRRDQWQRAIVAAVAVVVIGAVAVGTVLAWPRLSTLLRPSAARVAVSAAPDGTSVFVIGDAQTGCTTRSGCGPDTAIGQAAEELGWSVRYLGGTGYLDGNEPFGGQSLLVAAYQPDVVILAGGLADRTSPAAEVRAAVANTVADLQAAAPAAEVVVLGPVWESPRAVPRNVARTSAAIAAGAADGGAVLVLDPVGEGWFGPRPSEPASSTETGAPGPSTGTTTTGSSTGAGAASPSTGTSATRPASGTGMASPPAAASAADPEVLSAQAQQAVAAQLVARIPPALAAAAAGEAAAVVVPTGTASAGGGAGSGTGSGIPAGTDAAGATTTAPPCVPVRAARSTLLPDPIQVSVDVVNSGGDPGLASDIAAQLADRGFVVGDVADDTSGAEVTAPAEIRFGPRGRGAARLLRAYVPDAILVPTDRAGRSVELAVTNDVAGLAADADVEAYLARLVVVRPCP